MALHFSFHFELLNTHKLSSAVCIFSLKVRGFINFQASPIDPIVSDNLWLDAAPSLLQTLFKIWIG